jgi:sugar lactone lactonase YvrE
MPVFFGTPSFLRQHRPVLCAGLLALACLLLPATARAQVSFTRVQTTLGSGFDGPAGVAVDGHGNVFVADTTNSAVKEILAVDGSIPASPTINTLGSGFYYPYGVAVDASGNVYVADTFHSAIKEMLAVNGSIPASPTINTLGSGFSYPDGVAVDGHGNVFVADTSHGVVKEMLAVNGSIPASPTINTLGSGFTEPTGVAVDGSGNVYVVDYSVSKVKEMLAVSGSIPASPTINTLGSGFSSPFGVAVDGSGNVFVADIFNNAVKEILAVNGSIPASPTIITLGSGFVYPYGVAVDGHENVFVADTAISEMYEISTLSVNFGSQAIGSASAAQTLNFSIAAETTVGSIAVLTQGAPNLDFANAAGTTCTATTYSSATDCVVNVTFTPAVAGLRMGAVVFFSGAGNTGTVLASVPVYGVGAGPQIAYGPGTASAIDPTVNGLELSYPFGAAVDGAGDLFIADTYNNRVVEVPAIGTSVAIDPTVNGTGLQLPYDVAVDGAGDLFIVDKSNNRMVEVPAGGGAPIAIDPVVNSEGLSSPNGVAVDGAGDLFIADESNRRVVEVPAGGGSAIAIDPTVNGNGLYEPVCVAVDGAGDLFIVDTYLNRVVEVPAGGGTPVAIDPTVNGNGLSYPRGVAVDGAGDLFIVDSYRFRVVEVPAGGGAAIAIDPTVNGLGLNYPEGLAMDGAGDLFILDNHNSRVVEIQHSQPPTVSFPTATIVGRIDTTDGTQTVQVVNIGNQTLKFTALSYPTDFLKAGGDPSACTSSSSLSAGQECDLPIEFAPRNAGSLNENVTLTDNALNVSGAKQSIAVSGTGTDGPASTPTFSPVAGTYTTIQTVTINDATGGATIYYTTNGSTPTTGSSVYSTPITLSASQTVEAIATATNYLTSATGSAAYTINLPTAATPTFNPVAGSYPSAQSVTISDTTTGATIYYTTNGSTPTTGSAVYSAAISVTANETIEAIAVAYNYLNSAVGSAAYTIAAATPTFSPAAGTYTTIQTVTISDSTTGAAIYYTTNGLTPTTSSTSYSSAITVSANETLEAIAASSAYGASAVGSAAYTIAAATPTFNPMAGTYTTIQSVSISDTTPGTTIYFTTDGTTPTTSSTVYSSAINVSATETLKAIATASGYGTSAVGSALYTINLPTAATPSFSPVAGTYNAVQTVTISDGTTGATIYYTTDGTAPTTGSPVYSAAVNVSTSETLKAIAVAYNYLNSAVGSAAYTLQAATPTFNPVAGTYTTIQSVSIADTTPGTTIYYTTDGSTPTTTSPIYSSAITVSASETLSAIATATGFNTSAAGSAVYTINLPTAATPSFNPVAGSYGSAQSVTISDTTTGATIYYTTNGSTPNTGSAVYSVPISVTANEIIEAIAAAYNYLNSAAGTAAYTIAAATPTFSPAAGSYSSAQSVTISDTTTGAVIYYTTNGSAPTTGSAVYSGPIAVSGVVTVEAMATASGYGTSAVGSAAYVTPVITPAFSPAPGSYLTAQTVTISVATPGAVIYYTTNATTPTTGAAVYTAPLTVSATETIEAVAAASGAPASGVAIGVYTIITPAQLTTPAPGSVLPGASATFAWTPGNLATHFELWLGTTGVGSSDIYNSGNVTVTSENVTTLPTDGLPVYARLLWLINGTWHSADYTYTASGSPTPATLNTPTPGSTLTSSSVTFTWLPGSGVSHYEFWVGTTGVGSSNLYNSGNVTATSANVSGLPTNGTTVYARLYSLISGTWQSSDYTYTGGTATPAQLSTPAPGGTLTSTSVAFTWLPGNNATQFELWMGTTGVGSSNLYNSGVTTATSASVTDLPGNGETVYARLYWLINGSWSSADYTYTAYGSPTLATMSTPTSGSVLSGLSQAFTWNPGNTATHFELWVGTTGVGSSNVYNSGNVTVTTETVTGLPTNGEPFYVRLYSLINGGWQSNDYTYTANGSPTPATMSTPTPGNVLSGSSQAFTWSPGNIATHFELWVGTTGVGSSNVYNSGNVTVTTETVTGLPTNGEPLYVRLYSLINGSWSSADYTYTAYGSPTLATMSTPTSGSVLAGSSQAFTWLPGNIATHFELWVGTTGVGSSNVYNSGNVTVTTETATGLPTNGETVYVRLYSLINGSWQSSDYTYTAYGSPTPAVLTTPTPGSQFMSTSETFVWTPGNTATHFELWVGSTGVGSSNLYNSGNVTVTTETVTGLPIDGETVYARLLWLINGTWQWADYTYTAQ